MTYLYNECSKCLPPVYKSVDASKYSQIFTKSSTMFIGRRPSIEYLIRVRAVRTDDGWFEVDEDGARYALSRPGLTEERRARVIGHGGRLLCFLDRQTVRLDAVFQTVQLPARVADLHARLTHVDADALTLYNQRIHARTADAAG